MRAVIAVTAFGQAVVVPFFIFEQREYQRSRVPAHRPDRIRRRIRVAVNTARAGDFGELITANELPVTFSLPRSQSTGRNRWIDSHALTSFAVVGVDQMPLPRREPLAVIPRKFTDDSGLGRGAISIADETLYGQRVDVDLIKPLLHGRVVHLVGRIGQMARGAGQASVHFRGG